MQVDAQFVPPPAAPVATNVGADVTVSWGAVTSSGGLPVDGYLVERLDAGGAPVVIGAGCDGVVAATSCVETGVPAGTWTYRVRARFAGWTGPFGPASGAIVIAATSLTITGPVPLSAVPATVTGTLDGFVTGETIEFRLDSPTGSLLAGTPTVVSSGSQPISVTIPSGTDDAPHSLFVAGSFGNVAAAPLPIVMPPALQSLTMHDVDADGRVDEVRAVFDDTLAPYAAGTAPWTLTNVPSGGTLDGVSVIGDTAVLTIAEGAGAPTTVVGAFTVALAANAAGVRDVNGHASSFAAQAPLDRAAPAPVTMVMLDPNTNGRVNRVTITWSESLAATTTNRTIWTLANVPSGGTLSSVSASGTTGTLTITEGAGALDTGVGAFTIALAPAANGPRDAAGNRSTFAARAPTDGARPLPVSVSDTNGATDGRVQPGDTLSVLFSEPMDTSSIPATTTVTLTDPAGAGRDTITIAGLTNGARSTGANNYVSTNNSTYSFAGSPVSFADGDRTIVVTVGAACAGTCSAIATQTTAANFSFRAATTLTDVAGNLVTTTTRTTSIRLF